MAIYTDQTRALITSEFKKALSNPWFVICVGVACTFAIAQAATVIPQALEQMPTKIYARYTILTPYSCFCQWLPVKQSSISEVFFLTMPLLATIPYSRSLFLENKAGYCNQIYIRIPRKMYLGTKLFVSFCTGALIGIIPLVLNMIILACFLPAYLPEIYEVLYIGINSENYFSFLFYTYPILYVTAYTLLSGLIYGVWATFIQSLALVATNQIVLVAFPFVSMYLLNFIARRVYLFMGGIKGMGLSILNVPYSAGPFDQCPPLLFISLLGFFIVLTALNTFFMSKGAVLQ